MSLQTTAKISAAWVMRSKNITLNQKFAIVINPEVKF